MSSMNTSKQSSVVHSVRLKESQEEFLHTLQANLSGATDLGEVDWSLRELLSLMETHREPLEMVSLMVAEYIRLQKASKILEDLGGHSYFQSESSFKEQIKNMQQEFAKKLKEFETFKRQCFLELTKSLEL